MAEGNPPRKTVYTSGIPISAVLRISFVRFGQDLGSHPSYPNYYVPGNVTNGDIGPPRSFDFSILRDCARIHGLREDSDVKVSVIHDDVNLFGEIPKPVLAYFGGNPSGADTGYRLIQHLTVPQRRRVLRNTNFFRLIKPQIRRRYLSLCETESGLRQIKEHCSTADGLVFACLLSFPSEDWSYDRTDRIIRSVMSNLVVQKHNFLKSLKKWRKLLRKSIFQGKGPIRAPRELSYLDRWMNWSTDRRELLRQTAQFCQTRITGLGGSEFSEEAIAKFRETLTIPDIEPDPALEQEVFDYLAMLAPTYGPVSHVSVGESSCWESTRKEGGRMSVISRLLQRNEEGRCPRFSLEVGPGAPGPDGYSAESLGIPNQYEDPGRALFYGALWEYLERRDELLHCNVHVVDEPGPKARVITPPSEYHSIILQPWSHLLTAILKKDPNVNAGLAASRHGWEFYSRMDEAEQPWLFKPSVKKIFFSSDLETATDFLSHKVVGLVVDAANRVLGIPTWYGQVVRDLLTAPRTIHFPDGTTIQSCRGALMGDTGTKAVLTAIMGTILSRVPGRSLCQAVGDDLAIVADTDPGDYIRVQTERFSLKLSEDDTFVSPHGVFYTEETVKAPEVSYRTAYYTDRPMDYIDVVKIRLLLDVRKSREDFSYTPFGRITQLGKDSQFPMIWRGLFHLASVFQDASLHLQDLRSYPVYLPQEVAGLGKPFPFGDSFSGVSLWKEWERRFACDCVRAIHGKRDAADRLGHYTYFFNRKFPGDAWLWRMKVDLSPYEDLKIPFGDDASSPLVNSLCSRVREYFMDERELGALIAREDRILAAIEGVDLPIYSEEPEAVFLAPPQEELIAEFLSLKRDVKRALFPQRSWYSRREVMERHLSEYSLRVPIIPETGARWHQIALSEEKQAVVEWSQKFVSSNERHLIMPPTDLISDDEVILAFVEGLPWPRRDDPWRDIVIVTDDKRLVREVRRRLDPRRKLYWNCVSEWFGRLHYTFKGSFTLIDNGSIEAEARKSYAAGLPCLRRREDMPFLDSDNWDDYLVTVGPRGRINLRS